jgi:hypothetical protein
VFDVVERKQCSRAKNSIKSSQVDPQTEESPHSGGSRCGGDLEEEEEMESEDDTLRSSCEISFFFKGMNVE